MSEQKKMNRREVLLAARSPSIDFGAYDPAVDAVPVPPAHAEVHPTACDYCIVGCGYKAYTWPVGKDGGSKAADNAFHKDFPIKSAEGSWVSPNMHNTVRKDGRLHHVVVVPDGESAVNRPARRKSKWKRNPRQRKVACRGSLAREAPGFACRPRAAPRPRRRGANQNLRTGGRVPRMRAVRALCVVIAGP